MLFKKASVADMKKLNISVDYDYASNELVIKSVSVDAHVIERFMSEVVNDYDELTLPITIDQHNCLMKIQEDGSSQFDALFSPFSSNPSIEVRPMQEGKQMYLKFIGKIDIVFDARGRAQAYLGSKKLDVERLVLYIHTYIHTYIRHHL